MLIPEPPGDEVQALKANKANKQPDAAAARRSIGRDDGPGAAKVPATARSMSVECWFRRKATLLRNVHRQPRPATYPVLAWRGACAIRPH